MSTTLGQDFSDAGGAESSAPREFDEERSIREALRITLLFVAVVVLLLWGGVADAANGAPPEPATVNARP